jgi:hypothetical protein
MGLRANSWLLDLRPFARAAPCVACHEPTEQRHRWGYTLVGETKDFRAPIALDEWQHGTVNCHKHFGCDFDGDASEEAFGCLMVPWAEGRGPHPYRHQPPRR